MRPIGTPAELERRRQRAITLVKKGYSLNATARRVGCNASSVLRWKRAFDRGGKKALAPKPASGRPPRLTQRQKERLIQYLLRGALTHGYRTDLWTTQRVAEVIGRKFKVGYHRDHVGKLLHGLDWSCQKPQKRALERDEAAVATWRKRDWPRIKKTPRNWAPISRLSMNQAFF